MEHTNKKGKALPLCTGTMEARNLKVTTIDRRLHAGTEGFRNPHPFSSCRKGPKRYSILKIKRVLYFLRTLFIHSFMIILLFFHIYHKNYIL